MGLIGKEADLSPEFVKNRLSEKPHATHTHTRARARASTLKHDFEQTTNGKTSLRLLTKEADKNIFAS